MRAPSPLLCLALALGPTILCPTLAQGQEEASAGEESVTPQETPPQADTITLGDLGHWTLPSPWAFAPNIQVKTGGDHDAETGEGRVTTGMSRVFVHPSGAAITAITLGKSQALSLKKVGAKLAGPFTDRDLEYHGDLAWWHYASPDGDVYATGVGGSSTFVLLPPQADIPPEDITALLAGHALKRRNLRIDEAWITFDLPEDVAYVHRDASPFSWTRGEGIVAVDVTFDKAPQSELQTTPAYEELGPLVPGWAIIAAPVQLDLKGMEAFNEAMAEANGAPPKDTLKALVAAPGSLPKNNAIALVKRDGLLRVELRAEGGDAQLLLINDLIPMAQTLEMKAHYDWYPDSRRMRHKMSRDFTEEVLVDALPVLIETAALTYSAIQGQGLGTVTGTGLTVAQSLPVVGFQLFELGRARTQTEDTVAANLGYIPSANYQIQGYFGDPESTLSTNVQGIGSGISANSRFFRQRGQVGVNWALYWPQEGESQVDVSTLESGVYQPMVVKMKGGYALDPTTWLLPHRFGSFGDWHLGVGVGTTIEYSLADYVTVGGEADKIAFMNVGFNPTVGFHTRLFWGAVQLFGQGYITPSQLGLITLFQDTASDLHIETLAENGELESLGDLLKEVGTSAFLTAAMGTGRFDGGRGGSITAIVGLPFGVRGNLSPPISLGIPKGQGVMPPLGGKSLRAVVASTLGLGITFFYDEATWLPFSTQWSPSGAQSSFKTVNQGFIIGLGSGSTYLPSFSSGPR